MALSGTSLPRPDTSAIAELGYPTRHSLRAWYKDYLEHGEVRPPKRQREPKFTLEMRRAAVDYHRAHGRSLAGTIRRMGYPSGREYLCDWIDELAPGQRKYRGPNPKANPIPLEEKAQAVAESFFKTLKRNWRKKGAMGRGARPSRTSSSTWSSITIGCACIPPWTTCLQWNTSGNTLEGP